MAMEIYELELDGSLNISEPRLLRSFSTEINFECENSPIRFINFNLFKECGELPRFPENSHLVTDLEDIDRDNSFLVFISHCWLRGFSGAVGWSGQPNPDNAEASKFLLTVTGITKIWKTLASEMNQCFVWLDFGCMNQDDNPAGEMRQADKIVGACDCLFTPLFDANCHMWELPNKWDDLYAEYPAESWNIGQHAYVNRAWCRIEMMYGANIAVSCSPQRLAKFKAGLHHHLKNGRRPQFLYGSKEHVREVPPLILAPLQHSVFHKYDPKEGFLSNPNDTPHIHRLISMLVIADRPEHFTGHIDSDGRKQGFGIFHDANGDIYEGSYMNNLKHGHGKYQYADGDVFEGNYLHDNLHGYGVFSYADGDCFSGQYSNDLKNGAGVYRFGNGDVYEGEYVNSAMHGLGTMRNAADHTELCGVWRDDQYIGPATHMNHDNLDGLDA